MKRRFLILRIKLALWLIELADKVHHVPISRDSILQNAKQISGGAMVLYTSNERWQFAFRMFIDRGIFSEKETRKYVARAEKQRLKQAKNG